MPPFHIWKIAEEVIGSSLDSAQVNIVEPVPKSEICCASASGGGAVSDGKPCNGDIALVWQRSGIRPYPAFSDLEASASTRDASIGCAE